MERFVEYFLCPRCGYKNVRTQGEADTLPEMVVMLPSTKVGITGQCLCGHEFDGNTKGIRVTGGRKL